MSNPTFDQAFQLLSVVREADKNLEGLQALYTTGLLSDLLKAENLAKVDREAFRKLLGFDPSSFRVKRARQRRRTRSRLTSTQTGSTT